MSDNTVNKILIEEKQYDFITDGFLRPMAPIRRFSQGGNRFYCKVDETTGDVTLYSSGTTLIKEAVNDLTTEKLTKGRISLWVDLDEQLVEKLKQNKNE